MDGMIVYRHGEIDALAADIRTRAANLASRVDQMGRTVNQITADFDGSGDAAFRACRAKFDQAHEQMNQVLKSIEAAVSDSNMTARDTDKKNAGRFGG